SANECTGGCAIISNPCISPLSSYKTHTAVVGAQVEAIVGNEKTGLSSLCATDLTASMARPPPTANNISASLTDSISDKRSIFDKFAFFPYQIVPMATKSVLDRAFKRRSWLASKAFLPTIIATFVSTGAQ